MLIQTLKLAIILRQVFLFVMVSTFVFSVGGCSGKKTVKPEVILVKTNLSDANSKGCFGQNKNLDTVIDQNDNTLKRYFGSMVPAPSRSSLFVKRE